MVVYVRWAFIWYKDFSCISPTFLDILLVFYRCVGSGNMLIATRNPGRLFCARLIFLIRNFSNLRSSDDFGKTPVTQLKFLICVARDFALKPRNLTDNASTVTLTNNVLIQCCTNAPTNTRARIVGMEGKANKRQKIFLFKLITRFFSHIQRWQATKFKPSKHASDLPFTLPTFDVSFKVITPCVKTT